MQKKILFVDDEESLCFAYENHLKNAGYDVVASGDYDEVVDLISSFEPDLVIADIILGGRTGIDLLREIRDKGLDIPVIIITGEPNVTTAVDAVKLGAYDYLSKPFRKEKILNIINNALKERQTAAEKERYRQNLDAVFKSIKDGIITVDHRLRAIETNRAFYEIFQIDEPLQDQELTNIFATLCPACLTAIERTIRSGKPIVEMQAQCQLSSSTEKVLLLSTSILRQNDQTAPGVVLVIRDITRINGLEKELQQRYTFHSIIGKSERMQQIYSLLEALAETDATVLINGESGTGKELVAKAIHHQGSRKDGPLITVDCSTLTESILESELFGHTKGAFTGAVKDKIGRFQMAEGGTLFLDEIGNISAMIQQKVLRFLQEKEIERVGDATPIKLDVRIITATNADLKKMVEQGTFREDLYYRLKVMTVNLPPLRERIDDIPLLLDHFISKFNQQMKRNILSVSPEVLSLFMHYPWPGNIRELEHAVEHAFILCRGMTITRDLLPDDLLDSPPPITSSPPAMSEEEENDDEGDKERLLEVLRETGWNKAKTARKLGISRRTVYRQMVRFDIIEPEGE